MTTAGSGVTKRIAPIATYVFDNLSASMSSTVVVGQHVEATTFTEADLMVRFHTGTTLATGTFTVVVVPDGYDAQDPTSSFLPAINPFVPPPGSVQISSATSIPYYSAVSLTSYGRLLAVMLVASQGGGGALTAVMSVDLVLKGGDPANTPWMPNGLRGYNLI